jgi:hypothetical protein
MGLPIADTIRKNYMLRLLTLAFLLLAIHFEVKE